MDFPRFPDWLLYGAVAGAVLAAAVGRREHADAPEPAPPPPGAESVPLGPDSPFDPVSVIRMANTPARARGSAFSVGGGVWLTARSAIEGCSDIVLKVAEGRGVRAQNASSLDPLIATLTTPGGPPGLAVATADQVTPGKRGFIPGFPQGSPGEASAVLVGPMLLSDGLRATSDAEGLAWAETGRTEKVKGAMPGLIGAPVLDDRERVVAVVTGFDPRRGRILTATPEAVVATLGDAGVARALGPEDRQLTAQNYYRAADTLRRDRQVAQVLCLRSIPSP